MATLDPAFLTNQAAAGQGQLIAALYDTLIWQDAVGTLSPKIASSVTSTDAVTWVLKLRPNIRFSDGTPFDAAAVKYNWQRIIDPSTASPNRSVAQAMTSMDLVDPLTLKIGLASANGQFVRTIARNLTAIGSPTAMQASGSAFGNLPVGAGPFILKSWVRDSQKVLERNPNYWNTPQPYLDRLTFRILADSNQKTNSFIANEADMTLLNRADQIKRATDAGNQATLTLQSGGVTYDFNTAKGPFMDVRARRAIYNAFNFTTLNQSVEGGLAIPVTGLFVKNSPFYDPAILLPTNNPSLAQQLFDQIATETGKPLQFTILGSTNSAPRDQYFQAAMQSFRNVKVSIEVVTTPVLTSRMASGDYDMAVFARTYTDPEPDLYNLLYSGSSLNTTRFKNADMDSALIKARTTLDPAVRVSAYKTVQQIFADQLPIFFLEAFQGTTLYKSSVQDIQLMEDGVPLFERVWLDR